MCVLPKSPSMCVYNTCILKEISETGLQHRVCLIRAAFALSLP